MTSNKKRRHVLRDLERPSKMRRHRRIILPSGESITRFEAKKRTKKEKEKMTRCSIHSADLIKCPHCGDSFPEDSDHWEKCMVIEFEAPDVDSKEFNEAIDDIKDALKIIDEVMEEDE